MARVQSNLSATARINFGIHEAKRNMTAKLAAENFKVGQKLQHYKDKADEVKKVAITQIEAMKLKLDQEKAKVAKALALSTETGQEKAGLNRRSSLAPPSVVDVLVP